MRLYLYIFVRDTLTAIFKFSHSSLSLAFVDVIIDFIVNF